MLDDMTRVYDWGFVDTLCHSRDRQDTLDMFQMIIRACVVSVCVSRFRVEQDINSRMYEHPILFHLCQHIPKILR